MKKLFKVVLVALMVLSLVACGGGNTATDATDATDSTDTVEEKMKVVMLVPKLGDQSYFDTMKKGLDEAAKNHPEIAFDCKEVGQLGADATCTEADWTAAYDQYCEDGEYDLIISANNTYEPFLYAAAKKYPDQMFLNADASTIDDTCKNVLSTQFGLDDLGYVVGALSAALTKTGIVGVVVGMDNQPMNQFISGYCQVLTDKGVKYVISYPGSFTDVALGKEVTEKMIGQKADVIWQVAGGLGNGVIDACSGHDDVWCVGVDQDQYVQFQESNPEYAKTIVTSALKNTDQVIITVIDWLADGTLKNHMGETKVWGIADNGVGLAENDYYKANVSEDIRTEIADTLAKVASGEVEVYDCLLGEASPESYEANWPAHRDANILK